MALSMMEKAALTMLQNMTGMTPEEMRAMIEASVYRIAEVDRKLNYIIELLEKQPVIIDQHLIEESSNAKAS